MWWLAPVNLLTSFFWLSIIITRILFYDLASTGLLLRLWASELEIGRSSVPTSFVKSTRIFTNFSANHTPPKDVPLSTTVLSCEQTRKSLFYSLVFFLSLNLAYQTSCPMVTRVTVAPLAPRLLWQRRQSSKHLFYCDELSLFSWLNTKFSSSWFTSIPKEHYGLFRSQTLPIVVVVFFFLFLHFALIREKNCSGTQWSNISKEDCGLCFKLRDGSFCGYCPGKLERQIYLYTFE